jgi:hypothetical protein
LSKLDKAKTIIDLLKSIIITLLVGLFGMVSYVFINIDGLTFKQIILIAVAVVSDIIVLAYLTNLIVKKINELEEL